jgi:channel protein (hemolysin III family)
VPRFDQGADNPVSTDRVHEEYFNAVTHGFGLLLALVGAIAIFALGRTYNRGEMIAGQVYLATLMAVYAISTLSHAIQSPRLKLLLKTWDQGTIYLLIAGTYTPFVWAYAGTDWRWLFLSVIWVVGIGRIWFKGHCPLSCAQIFVAQLRSLRLVASFGHGQLGSLGLCDLDGTGWD